MSHNGNQKLHQVVNMYRAAYHSSTRKGKAALANRIVKEIKKSGSRFIRKVEDDSEDEWEEVDDETAYKKVGHALRLRKNFKPPPKKGTLGIRQLPMSSIHSTACGSANDVESTSLNEAAAPPFAVPQHQAVHVQSVLPSAVLHVQWPVLGTFQGPVAQQMPHPQPNFSVPASGTTIDVPPMPPSVPLLVPVQWPMVGGFHGTAAQAVPHPHPNAPIPAPVANQYGQLLATNQLLASLYGSMLTALAHQPAQGNESDANSGRERGGNDGSQNSAAV